MNSKERILCALHGRDVDHLPFSPNLAYVWESFPQEIQKRGLAEFQKFIGCDPLWRGAPCAVRRVDSDKMRVEKIQTPEVTVVEHHTPVGSIRMAWTRSDDGNTGFLTEHPLKCEEDFKVQLWMEENARFELATADAERHLATDGRDGLSVGMLLPRGKCAFQNLVEQQVGTEELAYALADFPDTVRTLLHAMNANDRKCVELSLAAPYDYFITWEDSSTQNYSPAQYCEFIAPEISAWCASLATAGKHYMQHACGHLDQLLVPMRGQGVFGVESISPPPTGNITMADARAKLGPEIAIIGGIEPTQFLRLPLEQLGDYVEEVIAGLRSGPFLLANSDSCPPGVTVEKFQRVADIARSHR
jgi:Uroporphyrinogen-III decarboxylase